jgi:hypothetical protein
MFPVANSYTNEAISGYSPILFISYYHGILFNFSILLKKTNIIQLIMNLCKHKDIFGKPNEGSHSTRIPGIDVSASDTIAVLIIGLFISWVSGYSYWKTIGVIFITGIIAHRTFCVRTTVDRVLFPGLSQYAMQS